MSPLERICPRDANLKKQFLGFFLTKPIFYIEYLQRQHFNFGSPRPISPIGDSFRRIKREFIKSYSPDGYTETGCKNWFVENCDMKYQYFKNFLFNRRLNRGIVPSFKLFNGFIWEKSTGNQFWDWVFREGDQSLTDEEEIVLLLP